MTCFNGELDKNVLVCAPCLFSTNIKEVGRGMGRL